MHCKYYVHESCEVQSSSAPRAIEDLVAWLKTQPGTQIRKNSAPSFTLYGPGITTQSPSEGKFHLSPPFTSLVVNKPHTLHVGSVKKQAILIVSLLGVHYDHLYIFSQTRQRGVALAS